MATQTANLTFTTLAPTVSRGVLQVVLHGVRDHGGYLRVSLHDKSAGFPLQREARDTRFIRAVNGTTTVRFVGVPMANVAIAVVNNADKANKDQDHNIVEMMSAGYAFSNDIVATEDHPSFDDARFEMNSPAATIELEMRSL